MKQSKYQVLITEIATACESVPIYQVLATDEELCCRTISWREMSSTSLDHRTANLVIVVVNSATGQEALLNWLAERQPSVPVLVALSPESGESILNRVSKKADDFIVLPLRIEELRHRVGRLVGQPQHILEVVRRRLLEEHGLTNLVGQDPVFMQAVTQLPRFARTDAPVCITGETGTGKELCARALHHLSPRRNSPFIGVDCGALPEQLFENEMFGHARGAFTDAQQDHKGLITMADGGTLFLDEIDALSMTTQAKLLRFLQERSFRPLGSDRFETANVRIIVATNRDLESLVGERQFRSDLFFRLNVLRLRLPPLRERRGDVELLAYAALKNCSPSVSGALPVLAPSALQALASHSWPGNVRELCNVIQRAVVACEGERILPEHLDLPARCEDTGEEGCGDFRTSRAAAVADFERRYVENLLRKHNGNVTHAAREAQQDRRSFGRFIKKYKINRQALTV